MTDATTVVAAGYGAMAERYLDWTARVVGEPRRRFLDALGSRLPDGADVVDLGCGAGVPGTKTLARRHSVLGVDASAAQLRLARRHMPRARFAQGDLASVDFAAASLDTVTAFYSLTHVPRARHAALLARIAGWLRPAGCRSARSARRVEATESRRTSSGADVLQRLRRRHQPPARRQSLASCRSWTRSSPCGNRMVRPRSSGSWLNERGRRVTRSPDRPTVEPSQMVPCCGVPAGCGRRTCTSIGPANVPSRRRPSSAR